MALKGQMLHTVTCLAYFTPSYRSLLLPVTPAAYISSRPSPPPPPEAAGPSCTAMTPRYCSHPHLQPRVAKEGPPRQPVEPGRAPVTASPSRQEAEPHFLPQAGPLDEGAWQRAPQHVVPQVDDLVRGEGRHTLVSRREGESEGAYANIEICIGGKEGGGVPKV